MADGAGDDNMNQQEETMDTSNQVNEDDRKVFVGGLPQEAKEAEIKEHFTQYGEVEGVNLKTDPSTGRSRGFAFVIFKDESSVDPACVTEKQDVCGKLVAVKKAQSKQGKVYIGKLKPELTDEQIKAFFEQYGPIAAVEQPFDKLKNERKNFCFITFEKEEPAKKLLKEGVVTCEGHELEIKKVTPKADPRMGGGMQFGGGRGGGRGGGNQWGGGGYGGGQWGGYGDYYAAAAGGYGGYGAGGGGDYYGAAAGGGWGGYGGGWGAYGAGGAAQGMGGMGYAGGKTPRGRGAPRARGVGMGRGQRTKPY